MYPLSVLALRSGRVVSSSRLAASRDRFRLRLLVPGIVLALLTAGPFARLACAHAIIIDSSPKQGSSIKPGPVAATLTFNSRLEPKGCKLTLIDPDGSRRVLDAVSKGDNLLGADLGPLVSGAYRIDWIALSVDGHLTRGRVPFTVSP